MRAFLFYPLAVILIVPIFYRGAKRGIPNFKAKISLFCEVSGVSPDTFCKKIPPLL